MENKKINWSNLTKDERSEYMRYQMAKSSGSDGYLPAGFSECGVCSTPTSVPPLCVYCETKFSILNDKLRGKVHANTL